MLVLVLCLLSSIYIYIGLYEDLNLTISSAVYSVTKACYSQVSRSVGSILKCTRRRNGVVFLLNQMNIVMLSCLHGKFETISALG